MGIGGRFDLTTIGPGRVDVAGSFAPNGTSAIDSTSNRGKGYSVSRTAVGTFRLAFDEGWPQLDSILATIQGADSNGYVLNVGDYDSSNKTLDLYLHRKGVDYINLDIASLREAITNDIGVAADAAARGSGGILASDTTPILQRVNGATDKAMRVHWAAGNSDEVYFPPVFLPSSWQGGGNIAVHLLVAKGSNTDNAAVIDVQAWAGVGDTEMGGNTSALSTATLTEYTVNITAANAGSNPTFLNIGLVPGTHAADAIYLYGAKLQLNTLTDLAVDDNARIHFLARFRNTSIPY